MFFGLNLVFDLNKLKQTRCLSFEEPLFKEENES